MEIKNINIRISQIVNILNKLLSFNNVIDINVIENYFRSHKNIGLYDRNEINNAIYDILRHLTLYNYLVNSKKTNLEKNICLAILGLINTNNRLYNYLDNDQKEWIDKIYNYDISSLNANIKYSIPEWIYKSYDNIFNSEALFNSLNSRAKLDIRVNPININRKSFVKNIKQDFNLIENEDFVITKFSPFGIRFNKNIKINKWKYYFDGDIEIQDEGSQLISILVNPRRYELIIDFCAGSGGKSLLMSALMHSSGHIYAFDISNKKLLEAKKRFDRSKLNNISFIHIKDECDQKINRFFGKANKVLVDIPCTGSGTLRRYPNLKWLHTNESINKIIKLQTKILIKASQCVKKDGYLIYSTCSILPEENQLQIAKFIDKNDSFQIIDIKTLLKNLKIDLPCKGPFLELRPDIHHTDGFFIAILKKIK
ncbi:Ribosomal RNA small subunit methyltransferase B [Candidatus Kinetoplastibacterium sorsogonicusi]|uniref:Ribosomal RNA small subunit methyltransferase B n=1 Tax=Candidatus Kinetoplastidibacterium kentomonadis TaxID=1576550 RepID=A0A3Q8EU47_9PROT|nr:RsmB/NOP family class I SAM-dependent RNA methyltransferase [Candidatus Kinetoplastibacterium sorsogonicusi]AWD32347.1 Ribosomal RNA small subunit methyltransferase B [Candidatus Kinetoplastibacterium sorsogonicusi]